MQEISRKTKVVTVCLGSAPYGDVDYLVMQDICGNRNNSPQKVKVFGNLKFLQNKILDERVKELREFNDVCVLGDFSSQTETADIAETEFKEFLEQIDKP